MFEEELIRTARLLLISQSISMLDFRTITLHFALWQPSEVRGRKQSLEVRKLGFALENNLKLNCLTYLSFVT